MCVPINSELFRESLWELLRELWSLFCSSRGMPFREWNFVFRGWKFEFRELLREYPGTLRELREWPFHSESVFFWSWGGPQASEKKHTNFFNIKFLAPAQTPLFEPPEKILEGKSSLNMKFWVRVFLGHQGPRRWDISDKNFMQVAFFCCFRQGVAGMSRDLGRDVPDLEKLYARKLWADCSPPQEKSLCASFPGKGRKKRNPHKFFRGGFLGSTTLRIFWGYFWEITSRGKK